MIAQISFRGAELWFVASWTMLHFLWLGTVAGLAAMACRLLLRRASADVRVRGRVGESRRDGRVAGGDWGMAAR